MKNTAILVVTYNRKQLLAENIEAIIEQSYSDFDFYIVDNASTDGTAETIKNGFSDKRIIYTNTGANLGGAGGFSFGLKEIFKHNYKYCWIMDDDAIPKKDALVELINCAHALNDNFSFMASRVNWIDGTLCKMNSVTIQNEKIKEHIDACKYGLLPIKNCSFVGCFVNLKIAKEIGLPIKEFFIYGDDSEYTLRLSARKQAYFCTRSVVIHKMESNFRIGIAEAPINRLQRYSYEYRNRIYIYKVYDKYSSLKIIYLYCKECIKVLLRSKNARLKRIYIIISGLFKGFTFRPPVEFD